MDITVYLLPRPSPWRRPSCHSYHTCCRGSFCQHPGRHATKQRSKEVKLQDKEKRQKDTLILLEHSLNVSKIQCFERLSHLFSQNMLEKYHMLLYFVGGIVHNFLESKKMCGY